MQGPVSPKLKVKRKISQCCNARLVAGIIPLVLIRDSYLLRLHACQLRAPQVRFVLLWKTGPYEVAYPVVLCFTVLERRDGDELGWRRGTRSSTVSMRQARAKDLWSPCFGFIPYITDDIKHELAGVVSLNELARQGRIVPRRRVRPDWPPRTRLSEIW